MKVMKLPSVASKTLINHARSKGCEYGERSTDRRSNTWGGGTGKRDRG